MFYDLWKGGRKEGRKRDGTQILETVLDSTVPPGASPGKTILLFSIISAPAFLRGVNARFFFVREEHIRLSYTPEKGVICPC